MQIQDYFVSGDIKGSIEFMRSHEEYKDILPDYIAIFENCEYRTYDIPDFLNDILRLYQVYYRDIFYCGLPEKDAADKLIKALQALLNMPDADEEAIEVKQYYGLTVDFAQAENAHFIVKGVRSVKDFEYERTQADINRRLTGVETILLYAEPQLESVSSSLVRELQHFGKDVSGFIPRPFNLQVRKP